MTLIVNSLGDVFWCITLVLAKIIIATTHTVKAVRVNDMVSEDIISVIIE